MSITRLDAMAPAGAAADLPLQKWLDMLSPSGTLNLSASEAAAPAYVTKLLFAVSAKRTWANRGSVDRVRFCALPWLPRFPLTTKKYCQAGT